MAFKALTSAQLHEISVWLKGKGYTVHGVQYDVSKHPIGIHATGKGEMTTRLITWTRYKKMNQKGRTV
uniref:Uncharacterized protein n=1 Tax=viral metagenome TaxID=1070528 RepID=A0A6M3KX01_9ZZZZ